MDSSAKKKCALDVGDKVTLAIGPERKTGGEVRAYEVTRTGEFSGVSHYGLMAVSCGHSSQVIGEMHFTSPTTTSFPLCMWIACDLLDSMIANQWDLRVIK